MESDSLPPPSISNEEIRASQERVEAQKLEAEARQAEAQRQVEQFNREWKAKQRTQAHATATAVAALKYARAPFTGQCVGVGDDETLQVKRDGHTVKIRLHGVDRPEKAQPYGQKARQFATNLVYRKTVRVYPAVVDSQGRTAAWVFQGNNCVNRDLISTGWAWYDKQTTNETKLATLEEEARTAGRGLWADCCAIAPWEWRQGKRVAPAKPATKPLAATDTQPEKPASAPTERNTPSEKTGLPLRSIIPVVLLAGAGLGLLKLIGSRGR